jgi:chitinase
MFGSGGSGDDDDSFTSSTSTTKTDLSGHTILFAGDINNSFPTAFTVLADLSSLSSFEVSLWESLVSTTSTAAASSALPPTTTTTTLAPSPTPFADCAFWGEGWGYMFEIYNIQDWATDGDDSLHTQEDGCGALTGWDWVPATSTSFELMYFNLPFFAAAAALKPAVTLRYTALGTGRHS